MDLESNNKRMMMMINKNETRLCNYVPLPKLQIRILKFLKTNQGIVLDPGN